MKPLAVFISYRREDAAGYAGRLADTLRLSLGDRGEILRDVDSMIAPGADFRQVIAESIDRADAFLAIIGPRWLTITGADGGRRLDGEEDVVRMEIVAALESEIPVIPVLIDGARMPGPAELPPSLSALSGRNAIELTDARWAEDTGRLVEALGRLTEEAAKPDPTATLPRPAHPLLGRAHELEQVAGMLAGGASLITLTGPGGIGKTTFSLAVARAAAERYERVLYCDLTAIVEPDLVLPAIARAAGIDDEPDPARLLASLARSIGDSPTLVVLDNFEHLLPGGPTIADLLAAAPGGTALVTSRAPLRVSGEQEYPIPPLPRSDAVALFVERARAVRPDIEFGADDTAAIGEICERLDGLPLAVELAAARVRMLTPQAMVGLLNKRLSLLTHGARDLPERQQTVRATIDWSYRLLSELDRALLARMSVFAGGATLEAIREICAPDEDAFELLERVERLAENSLIVGETPGTGDHRFRMLELIREFAGERVDEEGERADLGRRHAEYFTELVERYGPKLQTAELPEGLGFFDGDYANLTEALAWARDAVDAELELRLLDWLNDYWYFRGFSAEPWIWFEHALTLDAPPERRAAALRAAGSVRGRMDDSAGARDLFERALDLYEQLGDQSGMARSLSGLEGCLARLGEFDQAEQAGSRAIEIVRGLGDRRRLALALSNAGYTALQRGRLEEARRHFEEALALAIEVDDAEATSLARQNLGLLLVLAGELDRAEKLSVEGLAWAVETREYIGVLAGLVALAAIRARTGELEESGRLLGLVDAELQARDYVLDPVEAEVRKETRERLEKELDQSRLDPAMAAGAALDLISTGAGLAAESLEKPTAQS